MTLLNSASKCVFILIALTACIAFVMKLLPVDQFMLLAISAFSFYFTKSPTPSVSTTTGDTATVSTGVVEK